MESMMTSDEKYEWLLLFTSVKQEQSYSISAIKSILGGEAGSLNFDIAENFWIEHEKKYLSGEIFLEKLPITNLRDRLNAVEISEKNKMFDHLKKEK